jgi:hypothetical protein
LNLLPAFACFVHRNGIDTLLICDGLNDRVVEVSASGLFLRAIAVRKGSYPYGVAERDGVIAVSLHWAHGVLLLQYEPGAFTYRERGGGGSESYPDHKLYRSASPTELCRLRNCEKKILEHS